VHPLCATGGWRGQGACALAEGLVGTEPPKCCTAHPGGLIDSIKDTVGCVIVPVQGLLHFLLLLMYSLLQLPHISCQRLHNTATTI
jgi:hypothetical protein